LKLKCICPKDWDYDPANHKSKYKWEIDFGKKKVGRGRIIRLGRKTKGDYPILVRPFQSNKWNNWMKN
jgi:hypothetical protein